MKINVRPLIFPCSVVDWGEGSECTQAGFAQVKRGEKRFNFFVHFAKVRSRKSNEKVTSLLFPSTLKEARRVKMLALEMEEVHWCALVLMAGFHES